MARFVVRRVLTMILVLFAISLLTFAIFEAIPSDPAVRLAGRHANPAQIAEVAHKYGFDKPFYVQYLRTMKNIFTGQAYSYTQGFSVNSEIRAGLPATLSLAQQGAKNGEWTTYAADLANTRYSPLDQISADNFSKLEIAWRFKTDSLGPRLYAKLMDHAQKRKG